jgi:FkbM family methyltransferase
MALAFARKLLDSSTRKLGIRIEQLVIGEQPRIDVFELILRHVNLVRGKDFFFVQVGANDGIRVDPIRKYIVEFHWRGILVEPQPKVFDTLRENYRSEPQLHFENAAIAEQDGTLTLYCLDESVDLPVGSAWASFKKDNVRRFLSKDAPVNEFQVPAVSMSTLLAKHGARSVDLLQIDTEGYDGKVLKSWMETGINPAVIRFEYPLLSRAELHSCLSALADRGYRFLKDDVDIVAYRNPA